MDDPCPHCDDWHSVEISCEAHKTSQVEVNVYEEHVTKERVDYLRSKQSEANKRWREKNPDKYRNYMKDYMRKKRGG